MVPEVVADLTRARDARHGASRSSVARALEEYASAAADNGDSPVKAQAEPAACPPELTDKRPQTLARMLKFAELWRSWPTEEVSAHDLAAELLKRENMEASDSSIRQWKRELEHLGGGSLAHLTAKRTGLRFSPGARDRLGLAIGKLRAALDWHRLGRPNIDA
jgi:hypothetical protein